MQADSMMVLGENVQQGSLGIAIAVVIAWLRSKHWFNNDWTLTVSYVAAVATTLGIHFAAEGDFFATQGATITIKGLSLPHIVEGLTMFTSNVAGQKGYALLNKLTDVSAKLTNLQQGPTVTTVQPIGRTTVLTESKPTQAAEDKPGV